MGIEPTLVAWEATVLPLNYTRFPSGSYLAIFGVRSPSPRPRVVSQSSLTLAAFYAFPRSFCANACERVAKLAQTLKEKVYVSANILISPEA